MAQIRTDLALESGALESGGRVAGVETRQEEVAGFGVTEVRILTREGEQALGKPRGTYLTLDLSDYRTAGTDALPRAVEAVGSCLGGCCPGSAPERPWWWGWATAASPRTPSAPDAPTMCWSPGT